MFELKKKCKGCPMKVFSQFLQGITEEAREVVVVLVSVVSVSDVSVSDVVEEAPPPSSLLVHEIMVRLKRSTIKMCKILFIFSLHL